MTRPLVMLHGWGLSARVWAPLRAAMAPHAAFDAPDLPGHGAAAPAASAALAAWRARVAAALPPGALLCGWSLGALLALDLAEHHPEKVARLVLIGATPRFVGGADWPHGLAAHTVDAFREEFLRDPDAVLRRFVALQALGDTRRRELTRALGEALSAPESDARQHAALSDGLSLLAHTDLRGSLAHIGQPTLLLHGEHDALMPLAAARWLSDALPDARLEVLPACGHAPFLSRPADCAASILRFAHD